MSKDVNGKPVANDSFSPFSDLSEWIKLNASCYTSSRHGAAVLREEEIKASTFCPEIPISDKPLEEIEKPTEPEIQYIKENGVISRVEIKCTCGELIRINLQYRKSEKDNGTE